MPPVTASGLENRGGFFPGSGKHLSVCPLLQLRIQRRHTRILLLLYPAAAQGIFTVLLFISLLFCYIYIYLFNTGRTDYGVVSGDKKRRIGWYGGSGSLAGDPVLPVFLLPPSLFPSKVVFPQLGATPLFIVQWWLSRDSYCSTCECDGQTTINILVC
jgi:hypothetical protein